MNCFTAVWRRGSNTAQNSSNMTPAAFCTVKITAPQKSSLRRSNAGKPSTAKFCRATSTAKRCRSRASLAWSRLFIRGCGTISTAKTPPWLFPVVQENPEIRFDIYHMGMPFTGECAFLGKNFPNVYLDLCWSHIVSPQMLVRSLNEWLDLVPLNKVLAFGGDHATLPVNVKTHLREAKENLSVVFARRVEDGALGLDEAVAILKRWFYDNPKEAYGL